MTPHTPQVTRLPSIYDVLHHTASLIPPQCGSAWAASCSCPKVDPQPLPFQTTHLLAVCRCIVRQPALYLLQRSCDAALPAEGESFQVLQ